MEAITENVAAAGSTAKEEIHWKEGRGKKWKKKSREGDAKQRTRGRRELLCCHNRHNRLLFAVVTAG
ncbi:uncharacterized protein DS421_11g347910 [Arachis hypogaea]|nr:uncharacterized protein DS421_11g347910 [Arachis hypogaea]